MTHTLFCQVYSISFWQFSYQELQWLLLTPLKILHQQQIKACIFIYRQSNVYFNRSKTIQCLTCSKLEPSYLLLSSRYTLSNHSGNILRAILIQRIHTVFNLFAPVPSFPRLHVHLTSVPPVDSNYQYLYIT